MSVVRATQLEASPKKSRTVLRQEGRTPSPISRQDVPLNALMDRQATTGSQATLLGRSARGRGSLSSETLLHLQKHYGNKHVQRVVDLSRNSNSQAVAPDVERTIRSEQGSGKSLDAGIQARLGPALGADFSSVRVHTDAQADSLNRALEARAFTTGRDIFFREGEYRPGGPDGQELLAHELTHVVQQGNGAVQGKFGVSQPGDALERQADVVAKSVAQSRLWQPSGWDGVQSRPVLHRSLAVPPESGLIYRAGDRARSGLVPVNHQGIHLMVQRVGECRGRNGYNCNGVRCTTAAGRRGVCQWGGVTFGCNCRDQSGDEPSPSRLRELLPSWLFYVLSAAALAAIAACFATGACEVGMIVAAAGAAAAAIIIPILRGAGVNVGGDAPTA